MNERIRPRRRLTDGDARRAWLGEQPRRCHYCGKSLKGGIARTVDHATPRSRGGKDEAENWRVACMPCNRAKSNYTEAEFAVMKKRGGI